MPEPIYRPFRVRASVLMLLPAVGLAQQVPTENSDLPATDTVVVTGIRASYERAIEAKRNVDAIVDAISAEDVGKFPDQNVAESLLQAAPVGLYKNGRLFSAGFTYRQ